MLNHPTSVPQSPSVLIIEDNPALASLYQEILNDAGFHTSTAQSREAALEWLVAGNRPQLVLVDCMMPGMSTIEFRDRVRGLSHGASLKLIAFSCLAPDSPMAVEVARTLDGFAEKPDDIDEVIAIARRYTSGH